MKTDFSNEVGFFVFLTFVIKICPHFAPFLLTVIGIFEKKSILESNKSFRRRNYWSRN